MEFINNLALNDRQQIFYSSGTYIVPKNASTLFIFAVGAGGGGGSGFTGTAGTARGGGGGGGAGSVIRLTIPTFFVTEGLIITTGIGGNGAGLSAGSAGSSTVVECTRGTGLASQRLIVAGGGNVGGNGTASAAGSAGTGGANIASTQVNPYFFGISQSNLGLTSNPGVAGGSHLGAVGANVTVGGGFNILVSGGAGGAGIGTSNTPFNGGQFTGNFNVPTITGGTTTNVNGNNGLFSLKPFYSIGGTGGASSTTTGGNGGNGGYGSGGGGGGGGVTGGRGGNGGDGIVIITWW